MLYAASLPDNRVELTRMEPAINPHSLWLYAHILLLVYWLGADLGVLLLARAARRPELSFAERAFALRMAMQIDFTPRICFALMFPVGLQLVRSGGFAAVSDRLLVTSWIVAGAWIILLFALARADGTRGVWLNRAHLALQTVLLGGIGTLGLRSWWGLGPFPAGWLSTKVLLFALIFVAGIGIDFAFRPVTPAFIRLANEGSKPDIEKAIATAVNTAICFVLGLYALLLLSAFLGTSKPF